MAREHYYVSPKVKPGDSISTSRLHQSTPLTEYEDGEPYFPGSKVCRSVRVEYDGVPLTPIPYCTFGDHDNSTTTERSNHRVMRERFPWLVHVYGDYSEMLCYLGKRENQNPELIEAIEALERYPIADENDESELRMEREMEAWNDDGCRSFASFLTEHHDGIPNFGIEPGIPLIVLGLSQIDSVFEHDISFESLSANLLEGERDHRQILTDVWFTVTGEHGSGETSHEMGGGNIYFDYEDWYRDAWRAMDDRTKRLEELNRVREIDPRVKDLERGDYEDRKVLCDLLEEHGASEAIAHIRFYREDRLGDAIDKLRALAKEWEVEDAEEPAVVHLMALVNGASRSAAACCGTNAVVDSDINNVTCDDCIAAHHNYSNENYRRVCAACGLTGQEHPTNTCRMLTRQLDFGL